jgi:hypothetical protein
MTRKVRSRRRNQGQAGEPGWRCVALRCVGVGVGVYGLRSLIFPDTRLISLHISGGVIIQDRSSMAPPPTTHHPPPSLTENRMRICGRALNNEGRYHADSYHRSQGREGKGLDCICRLGLRVSRFLFSDLSQFPMPPFPHSPISPFPFILSSNTNATEHSLFSFLFSPLF